MPVPWLLFRIVSHAKQGAVPRGPRPSAMRGFFVSVSLTSARSIYSRF
jgi:hypothetical protein